MRAPRRAWQQRGKVSGFKPPQGRPREPCFDSDRNDLHPAGIVRSGVSQQAGLGGSEGHGHLGGEYRPGGLSAVRVDPARYVAGNHQPGACPFQRGDQGSGGAPEPALGPGTEDRVNHDVGPGGSRRQFRDVVRGEGHHPASGLLNAARPASWASPAVSTAVVRIPRPASIAAAKSPSPPLFPLPASTVTLAP